MLMLRSLLLRAARQLAADPRVQAKAADLYESEVKPRAQAAWRETKPKLDAAKSELQDIAKETDPRRDPRGFAAKLKARLREGDKRDTT